LNINCHLYSDWITAIRAEFASEGFDHSQLNDQDCAIRWQAWKRRLVLSGARSVQCAKSFSCPPKLEQGLKDLEAAITAGNAIWPWQSKLIDKPSFEDGLFNDYRTTHFHLGVGYEKNGYINRTGELLFAVVDDKSFYEVGIYKHGDWFELEILDIVDSNLIPSLLKV
jgi:hypothetical protein